MARNYKRPSRPPRARKRPRVGSPPAEPPSGDRVLFRRLLICGVGLLGGSLGMAARRAGIAGEVIGWGRRPDRLALAESLGALDSFTLDLARAASQADCVVLATPVGAFEPIVREIRAALPAGTIVTDVGSVKQSPLQVSSLLTPQVIFVGGHPMAGKETGGVEGAEPGLFRGARWVLTPAGRSPESDEAVAILQEMVRRLGAVPVVLPAAEHDRAVAAISHLPQALASTLMLAAEQLELRTPGLYRLAAGGFRDMTRLASSDADMWRDIFLHNPESVLDAIAAFERELATLKRAIQRGDGERLERVLQAARHAKERQLRLALEGEGRR